MTELLHITGRTDWEAAMRALPVSAVTEVIPVGRDAAGRLILPEAR